jgi:hypothetical protein
MLALCAQVMRLRSARVDVELIRPNDAKLARLFRNAGWGHFLDPRDNPPSDFKGHRQVPATQFRNSEEQQRAVNRIANAILGALPDLERKDLAALEWSVNEITDNVLNHSRSTIGGLVQVSTFQRARKRIQYIVVDAGVGILSTLRDGAYPHISSDADALDKAIREGVTRDPKIGQGNGLFGSYQVCSHSKGFFQLESGYGKLALENGKLRITTEKVPYEGTLVAAEIDFSVPYLLEEALQFGGRPHRPPVDFIELHYEQPGGSDITFKMIDEGESYGSRAAGLSVRIKLANLVRMCPNRQVVVDFDGVPLVSSSFADEVFGKLFVELGPLTFMQTFQFSNLHPIVKGLVDKAIAQRMSRA